MDLSKKISININPYSILLFTLFPLGIYFLWIIRDLIFSLLIGFILMSALRPAVSFLVGKKIPRNIAVIAVYLGFILIFVYIISLIIPPIIIETANFLKNLPVIIKELNPNISRFLNFDNVSRYVPNVTNQLFDIISSLFSNTLFVISTLFFGFYFLSQEGIIARYLSKYVSKERAVKISNLISGAEKRMSSWFWGEIVLMTVVGALTYIGLNVIGIKYALPLAVLAGFLEVVPTIGPIISAVPAILIGLTHSYFSAFSAGALFFIVQQLENNLIVPFVMKRAVGINPLVALMVLIIGGRTGGVLGVLLAIPLFLFFEAFIIEFFNKETSK
ncbi:hypothetical protein A3F03_01265 [Candidatus Roizmanbacteria bacterium RIFCSPHIGHO2_12_FULL_41_11]|uniref:AI-2E family transporter n=3 Tax=Candidatus Roizmaniibacteriota TaxID=1752723 RepID=A0A1F7JR61_9BACT|nr:MAG: hypothetical protein A3F03_01265 [Candidatus Roizmanbacteria bacterium RIFCSPHIGHO2_12_FULL_41_11]OGK51495.1 MAG: hypothetical protein A2966_01410 [Candidatus Roizmanbacteria bacterium RIFCSPLOWO2_01_FULL_41_22]OGK58095.1 MAG: hypothetical protein A3H86_01200 [Candidatus Roizmanbacteria bacterium RIFCSPLOWO2_02_FULL_41_9]